MSFTMSGSSGFTVFKYGNSNIDGSVKAADEKNKLASFQHKTLPTSHGVSRITGTDKTVRKWKDDWLTHD